MKVTVSISGSGTSSEHAADVLRAQYSTFTQQCHAAGVLVDGSFNVAPEDPPAAAPPPSTEAP